MTVESDSIAVTQTHDETPTHGARYCRGCLYCVQDVFGAPVAPPTAGATDDGRPALPRCPECGREFDPAEARTTLPAARRPRPRRRAYAALGLLLLGVVFMFANGLEPRRIGRSWTLWHWLGTEYGYRSGLWVWRGLAYGKATTSHDGMRLTTIYHASVASEVEARDEIDGSLVYRIQRIDHAASTPPVWRVEVADPHRAWSDSGPGSILAAFNVTRESIFGVQLRPRRMPVDTPEGRRRSVPRPDPVPDPFTVEGTEADVLWKFCDAFDLDVNFPERVPRRSDGWHPTLGPGEEAMVELQPRPLRRGGSVRAIR